MSENKLQKKIPDSMREKTQYVLAFGVIATMLFAANFPIFIIVFFGIFAFFLWKTFSTSSPGGTREIFEFYLSAHEILRDDERRWFGFEMQEVIGRGERIVHSMNGVPPLVYFTLGALYNRAGDHASAVNHLTYVVGNENSDEKHYRYASPELKNYVKILRKIEREPAEAPQTSAAVRALERARRNRGKAMLEESQNIVKEINRQAQESEKKSLTEASAPKPFVSVTADDKFSVEEKESSNRGFQNHTVSSHRNASRENGNVPKRKSDHKTVAHRRPISEVLHDIYDEK